MATEEIPPARPEVIIRVHGTGAARISDSGDSWWQRGSPVESVLTVLLKATAAFEYMPFHWTGANTASARELAAILLAEKIASLERDSVSYHLVGHSHGGSVIWMALRSFCRKEHPLRGLKSWITVGTPYLHYRPIPASLLNLLPIAIFALLAFPRGGWDKFSIRSLFSTVVESYTYRAEIAFHHGAFILLPLALLAFLIIALCLVSVFQLAAALHRKHNITETLDLNRKTFAMFQERGLVLWTAEDEAINGLASTLGLSGEIIPRFPKGQGNWWKRVVDSFKIPIRIVFNYVFAPAADRFIWQSVTDRLQGSDYRGWQLVMVSNSPCPEAGNWKALAASIGQRLLGHANSFAAETLSRMRATLGLASEGGHHSPNVLVGLRSQLTLEELIHTSYFRDADILAIISGWITGSRDERFGDSSQYVASVADRSATTLQPLTRKRINLFPVVSAAGMVILFAFLSLLAKAYVVPHTRENFHRVVLDQAQRFAGHAWSNNIAGTHHWLQALVFSDRLEQAMLYAQHAPDDGSKTDAYLCIALASAQTDNKDGIEAALAKIRERPEPNVGGWANNLNFVLRALVEEKHLETAGAIAVETVTFSERISAPFQRAGELANVAKSLAQIGRKDAAKKYAFEADQVIDSNHISNYTIWEAVAEAFYYIGDSQRAHDDASKSIAGNTDLRSSYTVELYETALTAGDHQIAQDILNALAHTSSLHNEAMPISAASAARGLQREPAQIDESSLPVYSKICAISLIHGEDATNLMKQIPGPLLYKFTNLTANELAARGQVSLALLEAKSYSVLGADHLMVAALARVLVQQGYIDTAIAEATRVEDAGQKSSSISHVALALSRIHSCARIPDLINQSDSALKTARFIEPKEQTEDLIQQAQALARCSLVPDARRKLRDASLLLDNVNDPSERVEIMMDMNKAFVRQASYSDSLDLVRQAFTPQNALDLYSDALLEATFMEHPELEKVFKPLRDETIYEM